MYRSILGFALLLLATMMFASARLAPGIASADTMAAPSTPVVGYTLHIDASQHYGGHPSEIIHHWCKTYPDSTIECLLFDGDGPSAHLVGVENIVPDSVWQTYSPTEQAKWHNHKVEIPKLKYVKIWGLSKAQADKVVATLMGTYGKVWILWDPMTTNGKPIGDPTITILK
jgi:hypothetical protein